jgi:hypothetical protein
VYAVGFSPFPLVVALTVLAAIVVGVLLLVRYARRRG